jgi:hypothetical protein
VRADKSDEEAYVYRDELEDSVLRQDANDNLSSRLIVHIYQG